MGKAINQQQRRIEIVGMVALNSNLYTIGDFADIFDVDEEMLKKDLNALRSEGIAIHQMRKQGIAITNDINPDRLNYYLHHYFLLCETATKRDPLLSQMVKQNGLFTVGLIVALQRGIRERRKIEFQYRTTKDAVMRTHLVEPLMLFQREGLWRLLAQVDGKILQFHIAKIVSIHSTNTKFTPPSQQIIDDHFKFSWDTWLSGDKIPVKLKLTDFWAERLSSRPAVDDQMITQMGKDNHIFEGTVNSIEELARWIIGRSGEVVALSPEVLRKKVRKYALQCIEKHKE